ncbi:MAG: hypothetical protein LUG99_12825 [Lachnospiraceae bacterium]|nr:hypothetical protein [Lachnospiraceae bacterium]
MKLFNTSVVCVPEKHYMADMTGRVNQVIASLIRGNKYFRSAVTIWKVMEKESVK